MLIERQVMSFSPQNTAGVSEEKRVTVISQTTETNGDQDSNIWKEHNMPPCCSSKVIQVSWSPDIPCIKVSLFVLRHAMYAIVITGQGRGPQNLNGHQSWIHGESNLYLTFPQHFWAQSQTPKLLASETVSKMRENLCKFGQMSDPQIVEPYCPARLGLGFFVCVF